MDGTTDVTRTVHFGEPNNKEREAFTRVLKGFIAVSSAVFPSGAHVSLCIIYYVLPRCIFLKF